MAAVLPQLRREGPLDPRAAYNRAASYYDAWHWQQFWRANEFPIVASMLDALPETLDALDLGTGTGEYQQHLLHRGFRVTGADISERMLAEAHEKMPDARLVQADARQLPFRHLSFDLVLCVRVLSHVGDLTAVFGELQRVLRPEGYLLFSDVDAEHDYKATRIRTGEGSITVETFKWSVSTLLNAAWHVGNLKLLSLHRLDATNLQWLPRTKDYRSIDQTGHRGIANIALLQRSVE